MPSKLIESTRMNVPFFLPNLIVNAVEPNGYLESSALAGFNTLMQQRQSKNGSNRWSIETITEEPELLHCDMTNTMESCHFIRIDFWKDEITPLSVVTIKDPTFDDIEVGDMVTIRDGSKYIVKAALASPHDMIEGYFGLIQLDGLEPISYTHSLKYAGEGTLYELDIVELMRTPKELEPKPPSGKVFHYESNGDKRTVALDNTVTTAQVFIEGCDLEDACEVLRTNGFEYEEGADYWFKKKPVGELKDGNIYRVVWIDTEDEHYDWQVGDLCVVEESNEETSYCRNIENDTVVSWLGNTQLEWYAEKE